MLLIRPVARRFGALRSFTEAPFPTRFLRTGAVAAIIVLFVALAVF
jgi:hypothetical protein